MARTKQTARMSSGGLAPPGSRGFVSYPVPGSSLNDEPRVVEPIESVPESIEEGDDEPTKSERNASTRQVRDEKDEDYQTFVKQETTNAQPARGVLTRRTNWTTYRERYPLGEYRPRQEQTVKTEDSNTSGATVPLEGDVTTESNIFQTETASQPKTHAAWSTRDLRILRSRRIYGPEADIEGINLKWDDCKR